MIVAFDLDGTLCNIEHRLPYIQKKPPDWPGFYRACGNDEPIPRVISILDAMLADRHTVDIWSGRSDEVLLETMQWLLRHHIGYNQLRMRRAGDYRQDCIIKGEWFDNLMEHERPVLAFDDRQQVVDMWRSKGVICCQVAPGDF